MLRRARNYSLHRVPPQAGSSSARFRNAALGSLLALGLLDQQILTPLIAALARGLDAAIPDVGFAISAYAVAAAAAQLVIGPLSDGSGRRPWLLGAAGLMLASAFVISTVSGYAWFLAARIGAGAAGGAISALAVAWVADVTPYARRGRVMGAILGGAMGVAALGQVLGARAATNGHQPVWGGLAVFALLVLGALWRLSEPRRERNGESLRERFRGYAAFLRAPGLRAAAGASFFASGGVVGTMAYASGWMQETRGFSLASMGLLYGVFGVVILLTQPVAGRIADRFGKRRATVASSSLLGFMTLLLPAAGGAGLVVLVLAFGSVSVARISAFAALRTGLVPGSRRAAFLAFSNTLSQLGIAAGAGLGGALHPYGFDVTCVAMAGFAAIAALLLARVPEPGAA